MHGMHGSESCTISNLLFADCYKMFRRERVRERACVHLQLLEFLLLLLLYNLGLVLLQRELTQVL
jgi:hypothetical protein